ncbi:MAG: type II toxin-antitoxin system RelE family toxin, partial [Dolichospermum sp.]
IFVHLESRNSEGFKNEYRIRVGDYRVRYEIDDKNLTVIILHCSHREHRGHRENISKFIFCTHLFCVNNEEL